MELSPLRQLRMGRLPKMVSWYDPRLLARVGVRTMVSSVFGQYADQRLMQAVTDRCDDAELCQRYDYSDPRSADPRRRIVADESGAFWIDYVADVGDGFEPTYALAYLLGQDSLDVRGTGNLRHGEILIMGGDQCYPQATREEYKRRLILPFGWAFRPRGAPRKLFAIPGNHDWYDGLSAFDSLFCASRDRLSEGRGNAIGGWECQQHRSYWAIRLPHNWWIWGADIQFSKYLDTPQVNYFDAMARQMQPGDNLIICLAEPSWLLETEFQPGSGAWDGLFGLAVTKSIGLWSFDANVLYVLATKGAQDTDLGDRFQYNAALSYRLMGGLSGPSGRMPEPMYHGGPKSHAHKHVHEEAPAPMGPALDLVLEVNGEWHAQQEIAGVRDRNSGGNVVFLSPGLRLSYERWSAFVSLGVPVIGDLNGLQAEPDWRVLTGVAVNF